MRIGHEYFESKEEKVTVQAFMAQRMAEFENLSKYRNGKIAKYQEWVDPIKRAKIIEDHRVMIKTSEEILSTQFKSHATDDAYAKIAVRTDKSPIKIKINPTTAEEFLKHIKRTKKFNWMQRIKKFLCIG